jgi:hypothetical protein
VRLVHRTGGLSDRDRKDLSATPTKGGIVTRLEGDRDGETYEPDLDRMPLNRQMIRVYATMNSWIGGWCTLSQIAAKCGDPEASVSARIRDFRKPRFGGHRVDRQRDGRLTYYRLVWNEAIPAPSYHQIMQAHYPRRIPS